MHFEIVHTDPDTSFYYINGEWVDATSEELLNHLYYEDIDQGIETTCIGEPTIVALFG